MRWKNFALPLAVAVVSAVAYLFTIMFSFNGGDSPYTDDTGEFQIALASWGTAHPTGYPLYLLLGSPFVTLLRAFGISPALAASLFSTFWMLLAIMGVAKIIETFTVQPQSFVIRHLSFVIPLIFAFTRSIWIHASIAEVYALNMAFAVALLALTLRLMENWDDKLGWLLVFTAGLGVAHHRLIVVGLPIIGLLLLPSVLRAPSSVKNFFRWLLLSIPLFLLGFTPYLDILRRALSGVNWIYGKTNSWEGLWNIFIAAEYTGLQRPNFDLMTLAQNFGDVIGVLMNELTPLGFAATVVLTVFALRPPCTRKPALLLLGFALSYIAFTVLLRKAVMIEANLMFVSLAFILGAALGLVALSHQPSAVSPKLSFVIRHSSFVILTIFPLALIFNHYSSIVALTRNPQSINYVAQAEQLTTPPNSYFMAPWGWRYFGLVYAKRFENRLPNLTIIDHNIDYGELAKQTDAIYTPYDTFFIFTENDFWNSRWGKVYLSSAAPNIVRVSRTPLQRPANTPFIPFNDGIGLINAEVNTNSNGLTTVTLYWTATTMPTRKYSTFVHFSDAEQISSDEDIIAKHDEAEPVYAWRSTTTWTPNEVIREDHSVTLPADRPAQLIVAGMYYRTDAGEFVNLGKINLRLRDGKWIIEK